MKRTFAFGIALLSFIFTSTFLHGQCTNADFENGDFSSWTGTYDLNGGNLGGCSSYPLPFLNAGLNQGPLNAGPTNQSFNHFIMNTGNDANLPGVGLPNVWPGSGATSAIVGSTKAQGCAESVSYTFTVTPTNTNFTYHYAPVLYQGQPGSHPSGQQPYFRIQMVAGATDTITCASFQVDGLTAPAIGGFSSTTDASGNTSVYYKPWTSVLIPLNNFVGQTVTITFLAASCSPNNCSGRHYAYAHIDAECSPLQLIAQSPAVCPGGNDVLTAPTGAQTYAWTGPGIVGSSTNQSVTIDQQGHYSCTLTTFGQPPCTFTMDTVITGSPTGPMAYFTTPGICAGAPVTFTDHSTPTGGITSWNWTFTGATPATSTSQNPNVTFATPGTYPVSLSISNGSCSGDTTMNVFVHPVPLATFTASTPVCAGVNSNIVYTGGAPASATYNWNFAGGNVASGAGQGPFQVNWNSAGNPSVTLTVSDSGCTSLPDTNAVVVNGQPVLTITPHANICQGAVQLLTVGGAGSYTWAADPTIASPTTGATILVNPTVTDTYTVTGTSLGCTAVDTVTVSVFPIPTSTFTATSPVCTGQNSTVTYTGSATPAATYNWNFGGGTATPGTGQGPQQVNWSTTGVKSITLNVTQFGCVAPPTTVQVTVNALPTATFTASGPVCVGQASFVQYTGSATVAANYAWNFAGGTANPGGTVQGPDSVTWAHAGIQNIILSVTENGCTSPPDTVPVIVYPIPTANFTVTTPLCVGQNGTIQYTGLSDNAAVYTWNLSGANVVSGSGVGPYVVNWSAAQVGVQTISLAVTDNGCVAIPDTLHVTVDSIPVSNPGTDTAYCSGNSVVIGGPINQGYTYSWSPATGLSSANSASPTVSLTNTSSSAITQTYTVTTNSLGCTSSASVVITVNPMPVPQFAPQSAECLLNNSFAFSAGGTYLPSATFAWDFGPGATPATSTANNATVTYATPQTRGITLTISQVSCVATFTDSVTVYPMPIVNFAPDTVYGCVNFNVCFINKSIADSPAVYVWNFGDGATSEDVNPCHLYPDAGIYSVSLKVTSGQGCISDTNNVNLIKVIADPVAAFTPSTEVLMQPDTQIIFTNQSSNALTYLWNFRNAGITNDTIGSSTDVSPAYNFYQYGLYTVQLHAYNALGCSDSVEMPVKVLPPGSFFIPNAFTPNGDGNNDVFYIYLTEGATLMSFQVFDRWGEKVHDGLYPWDGMFKGHHAPFDVYVYQAKIKLMEQNITLERKGSVTLIR